jgi:opacity protein-like surface antigen
MIAARRALLTLLFVCAHANGAFAGWVFTPFVGVTAGGETGFFDPDDAARRSKLAIGASATYAWGRFAAEAEVFSVPGFFTRGDDGLIASSGVLGVSGNAIVTLPAFRRVHPYALAGLGAVRVRIKDVGDVFPVSEWQPALTAGAGALVPLSGRFSLRADARFTVSRTVKDVPVTTGFADTYVEFWRISAGLAIALR